MKKSRLEYRLQAGRTPLIRLPLPAAKRILIRVNAVLGPHSKRVLPTEEATPTFFYGLMIHPPTSGVVY